MGGNERNEGSRMKYNYFTISHSPFRTNIRPCFLPKKILWSLFMGAAVPLVIKILFNKKLLNKGPGTDKQRPKNY